MDGSPSALREAPPAAPRHWCRFHTANFMYNVLSKDFTRILLEKVGGTYLSLIFLRYIGIPTVQKNRTRARARRAAGRRWGVSFNFLTGKCLDFRLESLTSEIAGLCWAFLNSKWWSHTLIKIGVSSLQPRLHLRQLGYLRYFFRKAKQNSGGQLE